MPSSIEALQMSFESMPAPSLVAAFKESQLSQEQRKAIIVKALNSRLNLPLPYIIGNIETNHALGGTDTTILCYPKADRTIGCFEANLSDLKAVRLAGIEAIRSHKGRKIRFKGL